MKPLTAQDRQKLLASGSIILPAPVATLCSSRSCKNEAFGGFKLCQKHREMNRLRCARFKIRQQNAKNAA